MSLPPSAVGRTPNARERPATTARPRPCRSRGEDCWPRRAGPWSRTVRRRAPRFQATERSMSVPASTLELATSSSVDAGTDIDLSVAWNLGALRLTVRDHGPALRGQQSSPLDLHGRGLAVVAGLSRAFGVLPTADGGKLIWAVLDAPQPRLSTGNATRDPKREPVKGASIAKAI